MTPFHARAPMQADYVSGVTNVARTRDGLMVFRRKVPFAISSIGSHSQMENSRCIPISAAPSSLERRRKHYEVLSSLAFVSPFCCLWNILCEVQHSGMLCRRQIWKPVLEICCIFSHSHTKGRRAPAKRENDFLSKSIWHWFFIGERWRAMAGRPSRHVLFGSQRPPSGWIHCHRRRRRGRLWW